VIVPSSGVDVITLGWEQGLAIAYTPALFRAIYNPDRKSTAIGKLILVVRTHLVNFNNYHGDVVSTALLFCRLNEVSSCLFVFYTGLEVGGN